ncbi:DUF1972 domain-containing protein [Enterobacteriaceae bacterium H4N4]|uniref:DUF1972 domain-containing protein n=1 Tax=Silvania confinis TaxID=2926470 RepID=A0A9J6QC97_9ENTR|nr:DUF1972 domain-containing protein [Silvania confinis]MCU6670151.1 DUF1972 domain-containing protein [Silvania confinis]
MCSSSRKKIAVVGTVGVPACYGGFESLVQNLVDYQSGNITYQVFCSSKKYKDKIKKYRDAELIYLPVSANGPSSILYDILCLLVCLIKRPDVVLILGVSGCIFLPVYRLLSKSRVITNIDGLEWRRNKWSPKVKWFLKKSEKLAVKYSDIVISDNQAIAEYVESEYGRKSEVIAYGGDHAVAVTATGEPTEAVVKGYFLSLCRIEPENNVDMILESFVASNEKLKFMGNWNNSEYGQALKRKYSAYSNIEILDPDYNIDNLYRLRKNCIAYIHGHSAGGTNPSLVEAMHFSVPVIAFDCTFNRYSTNNVALFFSDCDALQLAVHEVISGSVPNMGQELKNVANDKYCWESIASAYESLF